MVFIWYLLRRKSESRTKRKTRQKDFFCRFLWEVWIFVYFCNQNEFNIKDMRKNSKIIIAFCLFFCLLVTSCKTKDFMKQIDKYHKYSQKIYDRYLKEHGNASMIEPEGTFSVIWYYKDKKIYVTNISRRKISSTKEYDCDSVLDIKKYKRGCYPESIDADGFTSSFYDKEADSLYTIWIGLMVDELKTKGSDCPFMKDLREHIIKYKIK